MPVYSYKAKKDNAETVFGDVLARDAEEAIERVIRLGLLPISVEEKGSPEGALFGASQSGRVRRKDLLSFTSQLVTLLKASVPLLQAIELLANKTRDSRLASVLTAIAQDIRNGKAFALALEEHPRVFSYLYVSMVRAGEESGRIREMLEDLSSYFRKQEEIALKVRTALTYPVIMLCAGICTVVFILTFVLPKIQGLFRELGTELPLPTVIVIALSEWLQHGWLLLLVGGAVGALAWQSLSRSEAFRRGVGSLLISLPWIRDFVIKVEMQRFTRTMGLLLSGGVPILRSLEIAIPTLSNEVLKDELRKCHALIADGSSFGDTLRDSKLVPDIVPSLIAVGEESGSLANSLKDVAETYEQEINESTKVMTSLLEPFLILAVGSVIAFIVFAMLLPVFQMDIFMR